MEIKIFESQEFGEIRTLIEEDGRILFCGIDVATVLGYSNKRQAIIDHCKGVVKHDFLTNGGNQKLSFIPEPDVYRLIIRSKQPKAIEFEHWLMNEVLPSIRKQGCYLKMTKNQDIITQKAEYYDETMDTAPLTNIRITAKILNVPERLFIQFLIDERLAYRINNVLVPSAYMQNRGYIVHKEYSDRSSAVYPHFTRNGRMYLMQKIKKRYSLVSLK